MNEFNYKFPGIFSKGQGKRTQLFTKNLIKGKKVYGEQLVNENNIQYRNWNPERSKLAAALLCRISQIGIKENDTVLYLGASSGTTASHISDIVTEKGFIFALDFAPRVVRDLYFVCKERKNITPLLESANHPRDYAHLVSQVDVIYQDVAQRNQVEIFLKNCGFFLKKGGFGLVAIKARSIDVTKKPFVIYKEVRKELEKSITIVDYRVLEPYEKDHAIFIIKKK